MYLLNGADVCYYNVVIYMVFRLRRSLIAMSATAPIKSTRPGNYRSACELHVLAQCTYMYIHVHMYALRTLLLGMK